jgi:serine/threonine protein kinase
VRRFGKYLLVEPLASGGMADVWRAEVTGAEGVVKEVALKLVRGEHGARSDFVQMFIQEARLAARLSHANVVQVFEFDQVDGRYYIAMELVRGRHLGRVVERARELGIRLGLARAVHVGAEVAKGLAYAHRLADRGRPLGLVHRDVSPHNALVSFEGEVKLADFGIARAMTEAGLTDPGTLKGKLAYMAPEQARGGVVDARADVFSLGVVLWELCAGRRLFAREFEAATLAAVLDPARPSPPSTWNEEVPPELDGVILSALEKDPERRTGSAQDLAGALASVLLHIARTPDDWDLRALMQRLWPEGGTPLPGPALEATRVRPGPMEAAAGGAPSGAEIARTPGVERTASPPPSRGPDPEPTSATRTSHSPAAGRGGGARRRWVVVAVALALGLAVLGAGRLVGRSPAPSTSPAMAPAAAAAAPMAPSQAATSPAVEAPGTPAPSHEEPAPAPDDVAGVAPAPAAVPAEARPGVVHVTASPWAIVTIDGRGAGETPVTRSLQPGRHRLRASHPRYGTRETTVEIAAGRRTAWHANLAR